LNRNAGVARANGGSCPIKVGGCLCVVRSNLGIPQPPGYIHETNGTDPKIHPVGG
jgi:hypothetical protein